jgi:uncharacterized membrane protein YqjE
VPPEATLQDVKAPISLDDTSTTDLVQKAFVEARDLISAEIALAKQEARTEASAVLAAIVATAIWMVLGIFAVMALVATVVVAFGGTLLAAFAVMTGSAAALAVTGYIVARRLMPKKAFEKTKGRVEEDVRVLKDELT